MTMEGRCFCGEIRYRLTAPVQDAYYCHCRDCQYLSGSAFQVLGIVARGELKLLRGKPAAFRHPTEDGSELTRYFCPKCGTPIYNDSSRFDDIHMFSVSTLDDSSAIRPAFEIWARSKCAFAHIETQIRSFQRGAMDE